MKKEGSEDQLPDGQIASSFSVNESYGDLDHPHIVRITDIGRKTVNEYQLWKWSGPQTLSRNTILSLMKKPSYHGQSYWMRLGPYQGIVPGLETKISFWHRWDCFQVTDFGIAVAFAETSPDSTDSIKVQFICHQSRRVVRRRLQSDIYAMGIIFYEMLTGHPHDGIVQWPHRPQHFKSPCRPLLRESICFRLGEGYRNC